MDFVILSQLDFSLSSSFSFFFAVTPIYGECLVEKKNSQHHGVTPMTYCGAGVNCIHYEEDVVGCSTFICLICLKNVRILDNWGVCT